MRGIAPSILAADFGRLNEEIALVLEAGAKLIHFDVMDGHFVPQISIGTPVLEKIAGPIHEAGAEIDVHLMVERPERFVADYAKAGADSITVHVEATPHLHYALQAIHNAGAKAAVALNPGTPAEAISEIEADMILCMTVNPGWGGQAFLESSIDKLRRIRALIGPDTPLEVDGGIDAPTARRCAEAGATVFVAGTAVFRAPDPVAVVHAINDAARN